MIWFSQCRFEGFADGALWVEAGSNANNPNGIYLDQIKFETHTTRGKVLWFDDYCMSVAGSRLVHVGAYDAGYSTPVSGRTVRRQSGGVVPRHRFVTGEAPTTDKLMELWCSAGPLTVDGVQHTSTGTRPTTRPPAWCVARQDGPQPHHQRHQRRRGHAGGGHQPAHPHHDLRGHPGPRRHLQRPHLAGDPHRQHTTGVRAHAGQAGDRLTFAFTQDATGGRTVSWNAAFKDLMDPTTTANKVNVITFTYDGTSWVQTSTATNL